MAFDKKDRFRGIEKNESGGYEYTGRFYRMANSSGAKAGLSSWYRLALTLALLVAASIASGLSEADVAIKVFFVLLLYIGEMISVFILSWSAVSVLAGRDRVRETVIDRNRGRIVGGSAMSAVFAGLGAVMSIVYITTSGMSGAAEAMPYIIAKIISCASALYFRKVYIKLIWEPSD